jgi:5-aminolevulinate synthase
MDTVLRQSKAMCPFLKKSSPATLRALSTAVRPVHQVSSPCGGTMSKLQVLANRCPIMSKAIAVQSAQCGRRAMMPRVAGLRAFGTHHKGARAAVHTSRETVRPVESPIFNGDKGKQRSGAARGRENRRG